MSINGAYGYANQYPSNNYGGGFQPAANFGGSFMQPANQPRGPQINELWCLPVQNFRIDAGSTNLYSQKVSIDWPQFRPQNPIFSGPRVKQDATNIYANPGANFNFEDCGYTNFSGGFIGGGFPGVNMGYGGGYGGGFVGGGYGGGYGGAKAGFGGGYQQPMAMGGFGGGAKGGIGVPSMGIPNMGLPNMGFPNMGFPNMGLPNLTDFFNTPLPGGTKVELGAEVKETKKSLSGKGSIDGVNFKSGDGERYELKVESGKSYNLLSDAGIGLNGTYGTVGGETVLTDIALSVGGKIITLANDGTLQVDGEAFDKKKNNLGGLVIDNKDGTYTVKANGYEFELKASENGIKVKIDAKNARTPEGLWGVALDGEKNTESELQKAIKESEYKIDDALTFDYEDYNNIGDKYTPDLDDEERNAVAWNARNPSLPAAGWPLRMGMNSPLLASGEDFFMHGPNGSVDDAQWNMTKLQPNKFYNVFSDEDIQINGRFEGGKPVELGFLVNGDSVRVQRSGSGIKLTVNDEVVTNYDSNGITFKDGKLTIKSESDEGWTFDVGAGAGSTLTFFANATNAGANGTRSSGLLGDSIRQNITDLDSGNVQDLNGAGYLRNADGSISKAGQDMTKALREYLVDGWDDTSSGRSVYE